jgi:hypothetical protein
MNARSAKAADAIWISRLSVGPAVGSLDGGLAMRTGRWLRQIGRGSDVDAQPNHAPDELAA